MPKPRELDFKRVLRFMVFSSRFAVRPFGVGNCSLIEVLREVVDEGSDLLLGEFDL